MGLDQLRSEKAFKSRDLGTEKPARSQAELARGQPPPELLKARATLTNCQRGPVDVGLRARRSAKAHKAGIRRCEPEQAFVRSPALMVEATFTPSVLAQ